MDTVQPERDKGIVEHQSGRLDPIAFAPAVLRADRDPLLGAPTAVIDLDEASVADIAHVVASRVDCEGHRVRIGDAALVPRHYVFPRLGAKAPSRRNRPSK